MKPKMWIDSISRKYSIILNYSRGRDETIWVDGRLESYKPENPTAEISFGDFFLEISQTDSGITYFFQNINFSLVDYVKESLRGEK